MILILNKLSKLKATVTGLVAASVLAASTAFASAIPIRGVVEGFYGTPWTMESRIDIFEFCNKHGLNAYIYAPKDDPYHRAKWREPYPQDKLDELAILIAAAKVNNIKFIFAISPGLDLDYSSADELNTMIDKFQVMYNLGVRDFAVFFDDIDSKDGGAQAEFLNRLKINFIDKYDDVSPLITVPTEYFRLDMIDDCGRTPYTANFSMTLNPEILVLYTGDNVVCPEITDEQYILTSKMYNRSLGIWWNYPVTDYMEAKLALGPIENLPQYSDIPAIFFNPMKYAYLSKVALATGADYANDPENYNPDNSWNAAIDEQFGKLAEDFKLFARHSQHLENSWANVGRPDGSELRVAMDKLLISYESGSDDEFYGDMQNVKDQLESILAATKRLHSKLPKRILAECKPQLEQLQRIVEADIIAVDSLKAKRGENNRRLKRNISKLRRKLEVIQQHEVTAIISEKTARAFIDEVLNLIETEPEEESELSEQVDSQ